MAQLEKDLERQCRTLVIARNGEFLKFKSPGNKGVHDRLLVLPGFVALVELKRPGRRKAKVQPLQDYWQDRFTQLRNPAFRIASLVEFTALLASYDHYYREQFNRQRLTWAGAVLIAHGPPY